MEKTLTETAEQHVAEVMKILGIPETDGTRDTPYRFIKYMKEFCNPQNLSDLMGEGFDDAGADGASGIVVQSRIPFRMCCEHHLLPAFGHAAIGYVPHHKVCGLSKLARLVDAVGTATPSMQENITRQIAVCMQEKLEPAGVIVVTRAVHSCMCVRGVKTPAVPTTVSVIKGVFRDAPAARSEFFSLIGHDFAGT
jgi:GTP cyclohydrolase I